MILLIACLCCVALIATAFVLAVRDENRHKLFLANLRKGHPVNFEYNKTLEKGSVFAVRETSVLVQNHADGKIYFVPKQNVHSLI